MAEMHIEVEYSYESLFGGSTPEDLEGVDTIASFRKFGILVQDQLRGDYPHALVQVREGDNDKVVVDTCGAEDYDEAQWVGAIMQGIYQSQVWVVDHDNA